jgi:spermidine/putrescine-binding protein
VAALQAGDIDVAQMYIEDIGNLATQDPTFDWVFPQEGAMGWVDYYMPVRGSKVKELAEAFANHLLDPGAQTEFAANHYYWMSNQKYEIPSDKAQYFPTTDEELRQKAHMFDYDVWLPHFFDETGVYTRFSQEVLKR